MTTPKALQKEANIFLALVIINLMLAALAIGLGMSIIIDPATALLTGVPADTQTTVYRAASILIGMLSFGLGFAWITRTAEIIGGIGTIHKELDALNATDDTRLTALYIKFLTFYREKHATITWMIHFGRIGSLLFILAGGINVAFAILTKQPGYGIIGAIVMIAVGFVCGRITGAFTTHARLWQERLDTSKTIEDQLNTKINTEAP